MQKHLINPAACSYLSSGDAAGNEDTEVVAAREAYVKQQQRPRQRLQPLKQRKKGRQTIMMMRRQPRASRSDEGTAATAVDSAAGDDTSRGSGGAARGDHPAARRESSAARGDHPAYTSDAAAAAGDNALPPVAPGIFRGGLGFGCMDGPYGNDARASGSLVNDTSPLQHQTHSPSVKARLSAEVDAAEAVVQMLKDTIRALTLVGGKGTGGN